VIQLTAKFLECALSDDDPWKLGNKVLYDLCERYPHHTDTTEIVAKVWLIGRAYAAAIERGRGKSSGIESSNDRFYTDNVAAALCEPSFDKVLEKLARFKDLDERSIGLVLNAHRHLVDVFRKLTGKNKRSLASKYLHFHCRDLFFIYDSRAVLGIRKLRIPARKIDVPPGADPDYERFVSQALGVRDHILSNFGKNLRPREIDRVLLATAAAYGD